MVSKIVLQMPPKCPAGRIPYVSRRDAMAAVQRNAKDKRKSRLSPPMRPYACSLCPDWHLKESWE